MEGSTLTYWENTTRVLNEFGDALVRAYRDNLQSRNINASHDLADSVSYKIHSGATWIAVDLSLLDYWKYVEYGRKAGKFPPLSAIEEWIRVKPIQPMTGTQQSVNRFVRDGAKIRENDTRIPSVKSLAFLIGRKIAREGIAPRPVLTDAIDNTWEMFEAALDEAVTMDVERDFDALVEELYLIE